MPQQRWASIATARNLAKPHQDATQELSTYRNFALRSQRTRKDVQVSQNRCHGISSVAQELLGGEGVVADVAWVVEQRRLAHGDEVFEEALTRTSEGRVRHRLKGGSEAHLFSGQDLGRVSILSTALPFFLQPKGTYQELPDSHKAFSKVALEHFRPLDVFWGRFLALLEVYVFSHNTCGTSVMASWAASKDTYCGI